MGNQQSAHSILDSSPNTIPVEVLRIQAVNALKSMCFVETKSSIKGSAGLYIFQGTNRIHHCLITCHQVLPPEHVLSKQTTFKFDGCETFTMRFEWVSQIYSKSKRTGDYTIVEITQVGVDLFKSRGAVFLKVCSPKISDQFVFFQYKNRKLIFGHGSIQNINGSFLEYIDSSKVGISGSPLILMNGDAIGIHRGSENDLLGSKNLAICIQHISKEFLFSNEYKCESF